MADVTLSAAMRANLLSLQNTATLMGSTQYRLATGLKVNSALDNPSAYFAAQGLNNRAGDLSSLLDAMGQSVQTLKAADEGIKGLTSLVEQAKAIAESARGKSSANASVTSTHSFTALEMSDLGANVSGLTDDDQLTISVAGEADVQIDIADGDTMQDLIQNINGDATLDGRVKAELVADTTPGNEGQFFLKISTTGGETLQIGTTGTGDVETDFGLSTTLQGAALDTSDEEAQYDEIIAQIDAFIADTGYRGVNLLNGDSLKTVFNEDGSSFQTVTGTARDSAGLGISAADFASTGAIDAAITEVKAALDTLRSDAASYGNNLSVIQARQDFTTNLVNVLKDGASQLTIADNNEEGANLLALQTQQQLGIQSLSLASQANQSVLSLFG